MDPLTTRPESTLSAGPAHLGAEIVRSIELAEVRAWTDLCRRALRTPEPPHPIHVAEVGGAGAYALPTLNLQLMNRAIGLGCQRPATEEDVSAIGQFFLATGSPRSVITVVPGMLASESSRWLTDAGYRSASVWAKCVHDMASTPPPSSTFRIERVSARDASRYMEVVLEAFEMVGLTAVGHLVASAIDAPGWSHYLGYDGETAVATGALRVEADIAWIGIGATIPAARGRGWQTALLKRRLHDAKVAGCRIAVAETDAETQEHPVNHSYRNMMRTGFRLAYERPNWVRRRQE